MEVVTSDERKVALPFVLEDHENPLNWASSQKWIITIIVTSMTAMIAFCSSIYVAAVPAIAHEFECSHTLAVVGVTLYLLGFGSGPQLFGPLSEIVGRNVIYKTTLAVFVLSQLACALAPNIGVMLLFRFMGGFFGSPSVTNSGGTLTDIWPQSHRSIPFALFAAASFLGPVIAPTVGGFITEHTTWRWNFWLMLIISGVIWLAALLLLPETYPEKLLANKLRQEKIPSASNVQLQLRAGLVRPWRMLFTEPILFTISLYMAFVYGILYLDFSAYPVVFESARGWSTGIAGLSFLGIGAGMAISTAMSPYYNVLYTRSVQKLGGPKPEARLPHLIFTSWLIPIGLFWFGWTALPPRHWILPILSGIPFGFGFVTLFLGLTSYMTDCYGKYAASALAANALFRSIFGAVFPLFGNRMYVVLGTPWATSLLGFVAFALAPLPWVFYRYGPALRSRSKYHVAIAGHESI